MYATNSRVLNRFEGSKVIYYMVFQDGLIANLTDDHIRCEQKVFGGVGVGGGSVTYKQCQFSSTM